MNDEPGPEKVFYTADVVALRGGSVLLIKRGWPPYEGAWALAGGHVDAGETSRVAAARELLEETGVQVNPEDLDLVGVYDGPGRDPRGRYVTVAYTVEVPADTEARAGEDAADAQWVLLGTYGVLAFDHNTIVADALYQQSRPRP